MMFDVEIPLDAEVPRSDMFQSLAAPCIAHLDPPLHAEQSQLTCPVSLGLARQQACDDGRMVQGPQRNCQTAACKGSYGERQPNLKGPCKTTCSSL